jgi:DNA-binding MarR family transcriptional regulator
MSPGCEIKYIDFATVLYYNSCKMQQLNQGKHMTVGAEEIKTFRCKMRVLEREISKALAETTACCGVTLSQCHTLLELEQQGSVSMKTLTKDLDIDKSTLSRIIDGLVTLGFLNRETDPGDRRRMNVCLTQNGHQVARRLNTTSDEYYTELFKHIPSGKHEQVVESFVLLTEAMWAIRKGMKDEQKV